ncbi:MAG: CopD family protein [Burkholderiaceae bacterium]
MLWVKALHIIFVTSWFAGLFYLPRIYVNLAMVAEGEEGEPERNRLLLMSHKLYRFMTPLMVLALVFGLWLWLGFGIGMPAQGNGWMHAKLLVVVVLLGYHHILGRQLKRFKAEANTHGHVWYRWFNELPVLLLFAAVILVVVKPF